ncbi:hypothetical protein [Collinsella stercoris]|uniref:hypothetical protein n=1 Tax=Collinsella stercoris TaxID=147206 RepID=UPI00248DA209|nr:hypothetical protein [Collinsella stercoris]
MAGHANHDANAAAWAAMRAEQARAAEARRAERAAEKAARREANRAAWWGRMGREVPGAAEATEDAAELAVSRCKVDHVAPAEWHVTTSDGTGYMVEGAGFTVSFEGEAYTVPTLKAAAELVELAEQTRRDEADAVAVFEVGMRSEHGGVSYTVERATASGVTVRTDAAGATRRQTLKVRRSDRGQYVKLNANSKAERVIYAADMAA